MIERQNSCAGCDDCRGKGCVHYSTYFVGKCDHCEAEDDEFMYFEDTDTALCFSCWKKSLETVEEECAVCNYDEEVYKVTEDIFLCEDCLDNFWEEHCISNEDYVERRLG